MLHHIPGILPVITNLLLIAALEGGALLTTSFPNEEIEAQRDPVEW